MDKRIVYTRPDGGVSVVIPAPNARLIRMGEDMFPAYEIGAYRDQGAFLEALSEGKLEPAETEDEFLDRVMKKSIPADGSNIRICSIDKMPGDRTFRDAWTDALPTETVDVDMVKARDIARARLRKAREPLLAKLDVEYQRADEAGDAKAKASVAARKQKLRDVTADPRIDAAETPDALRSLLERGALIDG